MSKDVAHLAQLVRARADGRARLVVAVAGPPGSGKSTLAEQLAAELGEAAAVVPMDGFHFDNDILTERELFDRKGAPETFDVAGLSDLLERIRAGGEVDYPTFDRATDRTVPGGGRLAASTSIVVVEGNYLLLDCPPWSGLARAFDLTIWLDIDEGTLQERLVRRWLEHGLGADAAMARATGNDLPNARLAIQHSRKADFTVREGGVVDG